MTRGKTVLRNKGRKAQPADDGHGDDRLIVEDIKNQKIDKDTWPGETENNLRNCDALKGYFVKIGGRDKIFDESGEATPQKRRRRETGAHLPTKRSCQENAHPRNSTTLPSIVTKMKPPAGTWEDKVASIDACEDSGDDGLVVYISWENGQKTKRGTSVIYEKCPQKMLQFYEHHVKF